MNWSDVAQYLWIGSLVAMLDLLLLDFPILEIISKTYPAFDIDLEKPRNIFEGPANVVAGRVLGFVIKTVVLWPISLLVMALTFIMLWPWWLEKLKRKFK